jgi:hypothetical protein
MYDPLSGNYFPADLEKTNAASAAAAASTSKDSYTVKINLPLIKNKKYKFWFKYKYENPDTKEIKLSDSSPIWMENFAIPNLTKGVLNLTLTPGYKNYGVKFNLDPLSVQEDIVIYESLTSTSIGNEVYRGTSTNVTIPTNSIATRWITVRTRDKWDDLNKTDVGPLSVTPLNPDPDTSTPPGGMTTTSASAVVDPNDKSGFSAMPTITWVASTDVNTKGYSIRWSTDNPATVSNPMWEYNNVDGINTTTFVVTGLTPNITYYYEVAPKSAYNAIDWANKTSGTFSATDTTAGGAWSRLKSYISIGGATEDLFKIGTQIVQKVNNSTTIVPTYTANTTVNNGIILNKSTTNVGNNYWLNSGHFRVGSETAFIYWNGSDLYTTGKINATGGSFSGDVQLSAGSLYAGTLPNSGQRVRLNSSGVFAYNSAGTQTFSLDTAGYLNSTSGLIGGWNLGATTLSNNGVVLDSANGQISVGSAPSNSVYLSSTGDYRIWAGSQSPIDNAAKFKVDSNGVLYASGAQITGQLVINSGSTYDSIVLASSTATAASNTATAASSTATAASGAASVAQSRADAAYNKAVAAGDDATVAATKAQQAKDAADLKMAAGDINTVLAYNTTVINGDRITTGTIDVARLNITGGNTTNGFAVDGNGIRGYSGGSQNLTISSGGTISIKGEVYATSGNIGKFNLSNADFNGTLADKPRILFGNTIQIGWESGSGTTGPYSIIAGSNTGSETKQFYVNTKSDVFRLAVDTTSTNRDYAAEIRNTLRAVNLRYTGALYNDSSSRRFKENINYLPQTYYERILNVKPAFYTYIDNHPETDDSLWGTHAMGPIAEDLEDAGLGFFVERNLAGKPVALRNEHKLAFLLIPMVKDMKDKIDTLETRLVQLENANV